MRWSFRLCDSVEYVAMKKTFVQSTLVFFALVGVAFGDVDLNAGTVTMNTLPMLGAAAVVIVALGSIWWVRKVIKTMNRS